MVAVFGKKGSAGAFIALGLSVLVIGAARAVVVYGLDDGTDDGTNNLAAPANNAPWQYIGRAENQFGARASAIYLGYGYFLTANHVDNDINNVHLNGNNYAVDNGYIPLALGGLDVRLFKVLGDPGLSPIQLIGANDVVTNRNATHIGYGWGKGTLLNNPGEMGWSWAGDESVAKRWSTNITSSTIYHDPNTNGDYITTAFDNNGNTDEGSAANRDSGSGLFVQIDGVWKLAGLTVTVDSFPKSLWDHSTLPGFQPDLTYYEQIQLIQDDIYALTGVPEPSSALALLAAAPLLLARRRRK